MIWSFHDLGVETQKVWRLIVGRKELENGSEIQPEDAIEVESQVIS